MPALRLLDGVVDVYLPDAKYGDDAAAFELSGCKGYTAALRESLTEMVRQVGPADVTVRHLVLPDGIAAPENAVACERQLGRDLRVSRLCLDCHTILCRKNLPLGVARPKRRCHDVRIERSAIMEIDTSAQHKAPTLVASFGFPRGREQRLRAIVYIKSDQSLENMPQ